MTHKLMLQISAFINWANLQFPSLDEPLKYMKHKTQQKIHKRHYKEKFNNEYI